MKVIGIVSAHFLPHLGGVERYTYNLAKELLNKGQKVLLITSAHDDLPSKEEMDGILVYRLPAFGFMNGRMPVIKWNKEFRKLVKEIETKYSVEKLIINTHLYTLSCWAAHWGKKHSKKVLLIGHGTEHMDLNSTLINSLAKVYEHMLMWYIKKYVTDFYGVSLACNEWLEHFSIVAKGVFYNAINVADFKETASDYRQEWNIAQESKIISFVGRIIEDKGIRKLCEAFNQLDIKNVFLLVAGDGELYPELKSKYSNVKWLGAITHDKVIKLLNATDIYVLPTDYPEGFPTGVLEAAMCGCCIVTTKAGGSKELIIDDSYGIILEKNSVSEIVKVLNDLLNQEELIHKMGKNVQERVKENFTWKSTAKKVIEELDKENG
ncbi:MAG: glycosyltransferase family 4 protein [Lachnospiraceae bacterium]|nr:glycosyltransferase family 4 protein [Lachnospiraceae bacterium]